MYTHRNSLIIVTFLLFSLTLFAERPEWTVHLPFTEDAFWGVGHAGSQAEASNLAKQEILMQLCSRVKAVITMETSSAGGREVADEKMDTFFGHNTLRGAELVESFQEGDQFWILMKYCEDCGNSLIKSALYRYEEELDYDSGKLYEKVSSTAVDQAFLVERRLKELKLQDYRAEDILVRFDDNRVLIMIVNFIPDDAALSESQKKGLITISETLLKELQELNYRSISITGHANPTGKSNEEAELMELSHLRAETLAEYLAGAGITINEVDWKGGDVLIGDTSTPLGRGLNRRVEIAVNFE